MCKTLPQAAPALLESYDQERRDHALTMVRIARLFGRLYAPRSRVVDMTAERLQRMFALNVIGNFLAAREAVKRMSTMFSSRVNIDESRRPVACMTELLPTSMERNWVTFTTSWLWNG